MLKFKFYMFVELYAEMLKKSSSLDIDFWGVGLMHAIFNQLG